MKKIAFLLPLLLVSASGFGHDHQAKKVAIKAAPGIDVIMCPADIPTCQGFRKNPENNPLIAKINKLEIDYLNLKSLEIQKSFAAKNRQKTKSQGGIFQAYLKHLDNRRTPGVYVEEIVKFPPVKHSATLHTDNTPASKHQLSAIVERNPASAPILNNQHNPIIAQINKRERLIFNDIIRQAQKSFEYHFYRIEGHQGLRKKPEDDTFLAYINFLHKITGQ